MQLNSEAVQVANVERTEVAVESIVQQSLVNTKVHRGKTLSASNSGASLRSR